MATRITKEINAGSMADIAFLLLIFFLVTTTMDQDEGIKAQLPPKNDMEGTTPIPERNILEILVNDADQILLEQEMAELTDLKKAVQHFYLNPGQSPSFPQLRSITSQLCASKLAVPQPGKAKKLWQKRMAATALIGDFSVLPPKAVISIQNHRQTSYKMYISVYNEIRAAVNELRNELSEEKFKVQFSELNPQIDQDRQKIEAIMAVFPSRISEAQPYNDE